MKKFFMISSLIAVLVLSGTSFGLGGGTAALPLGGVTVNPGVGFGTPYTVAGSLAGFTQVGPDLATSFVSAPSGALTGTVLSQVWQDNGDGHLLFLYQVSADAGLPSNEYIRSVRITGFGDQWAVVDSGVIRPGPVGFVLGDAVYLSREPAGQNKINADFNSIVFPPPRDITSGNTSTAWYYETNATAYQIGEMSVQNGEVAGGIPVYVPAPEPVTLIGSLLGLGSVVGYIRRRMA